MKQNRQKKSKLLKYFIIIGSIVGLIVAGLAIAKHQKNKKWKQKLEDKISVVQRRDIKKELVLTGKVLPSSSVDVYAPSSGTLTELFVKEGDVVQKGTKLFSVLQDTNGRQELESLRNEVSRTRLELKSAEEALQRRDSVKDLFSSAENSKLEDDLGRRELEYRNSSERLALLEEKLGIKYEKSSPKATKNQKNEVIERKIYMSAPADGIVTYILKNVGESVFGTTDTSSANGREILTISNTEKMIVRSRVLEADLASVKLGMQVEVKMDAFRDKTYIGTLTRISQQGIEDKNAGYTYFILDVEITKPDSDVRSNMNATLSLVLAEAKSVLSLPVASVATLGKYSVVQLVPNSPSEVKFKAANVGIVSDKWVEILEPQKPEDPKEGDKFVEIDFAKLDLKKLAEGNLTEGKVSRAEKP